MPPNHALANNQSICFEELVKFPYICREEGSGTREVIAEYLCSMNACDKDFTIAMELGSP